MFLGFIISFVHSQFDGGSFNNLFSFFKIDLILLFIINCSSGCLPNFLLFLKITLVSSVHSLFGQRQPTNLSSIFRIVRLLRLYS
ncbi:hypothetical protein ES332_A12G187000v1 [Gossypium tomentosum]|uniref:Uncharacterized protein n=1 Tax=Gossypium tomentosum TaxID=34277 RepID=A0A5D2MZ34_GOSTO|nr:hypothetical protein ES332_A12G187000v1 [Gossypium tomentosum]